MDTSGMEDFYEIRKAWMINRDGYLLVYAVDKRESFIGELETFFKELVYINPERDKPLVLVANKIDLPRTVSTEEGKELAAKYKAKYFEVSAKANTGVDEVFTHLIREIRNKRNAAAPNGGNDEWNNIRNTGGPQGKAKSKSIWDWCSLCQS
eukprot:TRINITY_DN3635_c0_g2_i2.p2 TRINITY_DN3635_c0_g2~~TRINITY_DN3635_c0_g2_i2.p2  ORF type:complete len:152 (-),score=27.13 TRINITY_DN3635_c0_g2_i2:173-628(-)